MKYRLPSALRPLKKISNWLISPSDPTSGVESFKIPHRLMLGREFAVDINNADAHLDYKTAYNHVKDKEHRKLCFVTTDSGYLCIDIDIKDITNENKINRRTSFAEMEYINLIVDKFKDTYIELSMGGRGLHIWIKTDIKISRKKRSIEVYSQNRAMTMTGRHVTNPKYTMVGDTIKLSFDKGVSEISSGYDDIINEMTKELGLVAYDGIADVQSKQESHADREILGILKTEGLLVDKFLALWQGDHSDYSSRSEADYALLGMISRYSDNVEQIKRLFLKSKLSKRKKITEHVRYLDASIESILGEKILQQKHHAELASAASDFTAKLRERSLKTITKPKLLKVKSLDFPKGLIGDTARYIYNNSPKPSKEIGIMAALAFFAGICGRAFNVSDTGLNLYLLLIAQSGVGKEALTTGTSRIVHQLTNSTPELRKMISFDDFVSGQGLNKRLLEDSSLVNISSEFGKKLEKMAELGANSPMSSLKSAMTSLYQKSGHGTISGGMVYSSHDKSVDAVGALAFSFLGESTPNSIYSNFTNEMMEDGFMSRFTIIENTGNRPRTNYKRSELSVSLRNSIETVTLESMRTNSDETVIQVNMEDDVQIKLEAFSDMCDDKINEIQFNDGLRQIWNRAHLKLMKVAALLAATDNPYDPVINMYHYNWAYEFVMTSTNMMMIKIENGEIGSDETTREAAILAFCKKFLLNQIPRTKAYSDLIQSGIIPRKAIQVAVSNNPAFRKPKQDFTMVLRRTLENMNTNGDIQEVSRDDLHSKYNFRGVCYYCVGLMVDYEEELT